jgi:hypothetical protein
MQYLSTSDPSFPDQELSSFPATDWTPHLPANPITNLEKLQL